MTSSSPETPFLFIRCKPYIPVEHLIQIIRHIISDPEKENLIQYFSVPFSYLEKITDEFADHPNLVFGTDSLNPVTERCFTQQVAVRMLKNAGARFALVGTAEKRYVMRESNESISLKIRRCFDEQLEPILCFGETLQEYQKGKSDEVLKGQISSGLKAIQASEIPAMRLIYEAPWADRLSQKPTGEQLKEAQVRCRKIMGHLLGEGALEKIQIIQAFPPDTENVKEFVESPVYQGVFIPLSMTVQEMPDIKFFAFVPESEKPKDISAPAPFVPIEEKAAPVEAVETVPEEEFFAAEEEEKVKAVPELSLDYVEAEQKAEMLAEEVAEAIEELPKEAILPAESVKTPEEPVKEAPPSKINLTTMISESGGGIAVPVEEVVNSEEESEDSEDSFAEGMFDEDDEEKK